MEIKAVIVFPNVGSIFAAKSAYRHMSIGWTTTVWTLINKYGLHWQQNDYTPRAHTLSLEKKKRFAIKLAKEHSCHIIYLKRKRAAHIVKVSEGFFNLIPFQVGDI